MTPQSRRGDGIGELVTIASSDGPRSGLFSMTRPVDNVLGRFYPVAGQSKQSRPLIHLDDPKRQYLSFINLVEPHVLAAIRRRYGVKLPKVRTALDYVKRQFRIESIRPSLATLNRTWRLSPTRVSWS